MKAELANDTLTIDHSDGCGFKHTYEHFKTDGGPTVCPGCGGALNLVTPQSMEARIAQLEALLAAQGVKA